MALRARLVFELGLWFGEPLNMRKDGGKMTEDFESRLRKIRESSQAKKEAESGRYKKFDADWRTLAQGVIKPVMEATEQAYLSGEGPHVQCVEETDGFKLVATIGRNRTYELHYKSYWPNCQVQEITTDPHGGRQERNLELGSLSKQTVENRVCQFLERLPHR